MIWTIFFSALWLGILTAISPCPLATNIAAISFISRNSGEKKHVILSGFLYSLGRTAVYILLGILITAGMLGSFEISQFLQKYMNEALGPILIIMGLVLLGWIGSGLSVNIEVGRLQEKAKTGGAIWAIPIGFLFALSFCPVSAGLFFGALLPLALKYESSILLPVAYGIGTSLPVVIFAILMAFGSVYVGKTFNKLKTIEYWIRTVTGSIFIFSGIYYIFIYIFEVLV